MLVAFAISVAILIGMYLAFEIARSKGWLADLDAEDEDATTQLRNSIKERRR